ncbi:hypothetical protein ACFOHS_08960 [Jhaorihella thermophila]
MSKEVVDARAPWAGERRRLAPPGMVERVPELVIQLVDLGVFLFGAVEDVVPHQVHRQERLALRVQRLEDHLGIVPFAQCDDHELHPVEKRGQQGFEPLFESFPGVRFVGDRFSRGFFLFIPEVVVGRPILREMIDLLIEKARRRAAPGAGCFWEHVLPSSAWRSRAALRHGFSQ